MVPFVAGVVKVVVLPLSTNPLQKEQAMAGVSQTQVPDISLTSNEKTTRTATPERLHALDAVRAIALLLGIVPHGTMSFMPAVSCWCGSTIGLYGQDGLVTC